MDAMYSLPLCSRRDSLRAGIGLRSPHLAEAMAVHPMTGFFEIHPENYLGGGGGRQALLELRRDYAVFVHAVGLSLGSASGIDLDHLRRIAGLTDELQPELVSDHLSWSVAKGEYLNDLLPLPYTEEALATVARNLDHVQEVLKRPLLIENPSAYLAFRDADYSEAEFLAELARRSGCGILLDVNNLYVSAQNLGFDTAGYLADLPPASIRQYHLAGHAVNRVDGLEILIDDHGSRVDLAVWDLFAEAVSRFGPRPTTVEWDSALPPLITLLSEARTAEMILQAAFQERADA